MRLIPLLTASFFIVSCTSAPKAPSDSLTPKAPSNGPTSSPRERQPAETPEGMEPYRGQANYLWKGLLFNLGTVSEIGSRWDGLVKYNLHDTGVDPENPEICKAMMAKPHRTAEGQCYMYGQNIFADQPNVGAKNQRFGRNTDHPGKGRIKDRKVYDILDPNPRLLSRELLTRKNGTIPVPFLNLMAAAWLQAENHDWFSHGKNVSPHSTKNVPEAERARYQPFYGMIQVPAVPGDQVFPQGMMVPRTRPDLTPLDRQKYPVTYRNAVTHWWDASHIYGSSERAIQEIRTNPETGRLYEDGLIAVDETNRRLFYVTTENQKLYENREIGTPITGFTDNWWVGLELIHTLFTLEHNTVARMLKKNHPGMTGDEIFETSRLIISALIAKIHTIEWTPALLFNKGLQVGMYANWYGLKTNDSKLTAAFAKWVGQNVSSSSAAINGLVGADVPLDLSNVPFTLTEEFVAVYRMHPLIPDAIDFKNLDGSNAAAIPIQNGLFEKAGPLMASKSSENMLYSFLTTHPGALTLNNFPTFMQDIQVQRNTEGLKTVHMDMGAMDVLRDRERKVPRYNQFREQLGLKPIKKFSDLSKDKDVIARLEKLYGSDVDKLDLQIGCLAENDRYDGFAFGTTAFTIFQLMASRRLMTDPFFHEYYTPQYYTAEGLKWIDDTFLSDVIVRHFPEMKPKMNKVLNAFHPWN